MLKIMNNLVKFLSAASGSKITPNKAVFPLAKFSVIMPTENDTRQSLLNFPWPPWTTRD